MRSADCHGPAPPRTQRTRPHRKVRPSASGSPVSVSVNPTAVPATGTYSGTVTITATGLSGSPAVIPVTFNVTSNALTISPGSLSFTAQLKSNAPSPQSIAVSSSGSGVNYSVAVATSSGGNWLSYGVNSYYTPATVSVS